MVEMEKQVSKRIKDFLEGIGLTVNGLSKVIGIGQPTLSKQLKDGGCGASLTTIVLLLEAYPDLSAEWLLRGDGDMEIGSRRDNTKNTVVMENEIARLKDENSRLLAIVEALSGVNKKGNVG